jgi:hypothetical protein
MYYIYDFFPPKILNIYNIISVCIIFMIFIVHRCFNIMLLQIIMRLYLLGAFFLRRSSKT